MMQGGSLQQATPSSFAMGSLRRDLESFSGEQPRTQSLTWTAEFDPRSRSQMRNALPNEKSNGVHSSTFSPAEFQRFQQHKGASSARWNQASRNESLLNGYQRPLQGMSFGMNSARLGGIYAPLNGIQKQSTLPSEAKGKGRLVELDDRNWEEEFAEIDAVDRVDVDRQANDAMEMELNEMDRLVDTETNEFGDFESIWRSIEAERQANRGLVYDDYDADDISLGDFNPWGDFDTIHTHSNVRDPQLGDYLFEEDNVFKTVGNPFEEGVKIMEGSGNLSLAALAFEAAVQQDPQHVAAWNMLGSAQAQNEKELPAIRALEQALKVDPTNLEALMGLAVSYTNEGYDATAYRTLERWLSIKYPQILSPEDLSVPNEIGFTDRQQLHEKVTNLFIQAAQLSPNGEQMDPDVQVGLGVLFYGDEEFAKAVDCFEAALASTESGSTNQRQQVHLLWNRLGATLANSGRSEEAIAAYERALNLNPNFVRARYNLGVSCINIHCYEEAAQHLLGALSMHSVVEKEGLERVQEVVGDGLKRLDLENMLSMNQSTNLYETLRKVFHSMNREDLAQMVVPGMDVDIFRQEFDF